MPKSVIITCAPTGGIHAPTMSPHLPVTPAEIATASIEAAEAGDVILFDPSLNGGTVALVDSELVIDKALSIDASTLSGGLRIVGAGASRVLRISGTGPVSLECLEIAGGVADSGGGRRPQ